MCSSWLQLSRVTVHVVALAVVACLAACGEVAHAQGILAGEAVERESVDLRPRTVAVVPFTNISGQPDDDWIGAGIAETVTADLAQFGELVPRPVEAQSAVSFADLDPLVGQLQSLVEHGSTQGFLDLLTAEADAEAGREFARKALHAGVSRAVVRARFLVPLEDYPEGTGYRLTVEVFTESGDTGRLQTWQLDVTRSVLADGTPGSWRIAGHERPDSIEGLRHLTLGPDTQFDATDLTVTGEDMTLHMSRGSAFVSEIESGITGVVLVGDGVLTFSPEPEAERRQVEIFSGNETLEVEFTHAFLRVNPTMFGSRVTTTALVETAVDEGVFEQARELFDEMAGLTFTVELGDLSDRTWWFTPSVGNFIAEVRTRRFGDLTYTEAAAQSEDISLYTRDSQRVISLYTSAQQRAAQGRYYGNQDTVSYDVLDYDIEASFEPRGVARDSLLSQPRLRGCWIEGTTRLALRVTGSNVRTLTLQLADDLQVHSVTSRELGSLLFFRMSGRNNIIVNLPTEAPAGTEVALVVRYSGLLEADQLDENWIGRMRLLGPPGGDVTYGVAERRYLYSNSSYWYPQSIVSDFATATMTLTIPADYGMVASGDPEDGNPPVDSVAAMGTHTYSFVTVQPTRYLACLISRFVPDDTPATEVTLDVPPDGFEHERPGVSYDSLSLSVEANPFSRDRITEFSDKTAEILRFYASLVGDIPYPIFTLALTDSRLPGGHSPAYFAVLNQPLPVHGGLMQTWRTDPAAFSDYPSFFLAHELAHQWWGQAVGWKNYHEQWLSEGLAQYFAALYAHEEGGDEMFAEVLSELRRWSIRHSDQGPVYLGYRLGHIEDKPRVFRALVYNKGALVLHMLRRLVGDEAFFNGLRRFYNDMRFRMAGTDDLIRAFEAESGRSLETFFERWIHEFDVPTLRFDYQEAVAANRPGESDVVLRFAQEGKLFEVPVTVTLRYRSGAEETVVVAVTEQLTEVRLPLAGRLRGVDVNEDDAALAEITR